MNRKTVVMGIFCLLIPLSPSFGLIPLEGIVLGELSEEQVNEQSDPLNYVYQYKNGGIELSTDEGLRKRELERIQLYRGFAWDGQNLKESCRVNSNISYLSNWQEEQALRAMSATLQYIGLDITVRAIPEYAKALGLSQEDFENLARNIGQKYCSNNVSVFSKKLIINNLISKFSQKKGSFSLPALGESNFFPSELKGLEKTANFTKRGFQYSLQLFRNFCSWGGRVNQPRLLTTFLKDPYIMAFVIRNLAQQKIVLKNSDLQLNYSPETVQVGCQDFICRKMLRSVWKKNVPRSLGSITYKNDFERLYCHRTRDLLTYPKDAKKVVQEWINSETLDQKKILTSHFISLLTSFPEWSLGIDKYSEFQKILNLGLEKTWNSWSELALKNTTKDIYHEENLRIERVKPVTLNDAREFPFPLHLEVNLGEFDRFTSGIGKIDFTLPLRFHRSFLAYIYREWRNFDPQEFERREVIRSVLIRNVEDKMAEVQKIKFMKRKLAGLSSLVADEILRRFELYSGKELSSRTDHSIVELPLNFHMGLFALRYLYQARPYLQSDSELDLNSKSDSDSGSDSDSKMKSNQ